MPNDNVVRLIQPGTIEDQLTEVLRHGARALLAQAVEAEVAGFLASMPISRPGTGTSVLSATVTCLSAR